ncbi:CBU_0592 family membrane protein [Mycetocola saprophilus]|uniref:CBU_0592 family membrane protein n=1 Tax=Mycetocola saprophilus TaxID=76636 RepID=UPI003BF03104
MDFSLLIVAAGWIGAILTVAAYGLLSAGKLAADSPWFQVGNIVGAGMLLISAASNGAWPSAVVNGIWIVIGLQASVMLVRRARQRARSAASDPMTDALPTITSTGTGTVPVIGEQPDQRDEILPPTVAIPVITAAMLAEEHARREALTAATHEHTDTGRVSISV